MNAANCALANGLVSAAYVQQGQQALTARCNLVKTLLSQRKLPVDGWDDATIEMLLQVSATFLDSSIVPLFTSQPHLTVLYTGCSLHGQQQLPGQHWCRRAGSKGSKRSGGKAALQTGPWDGPFRGCCCRTAQGKRAYGTRYNHILSHRQWHIRDIIRTYANGIDTVTRIHSSACCNT